jgi:Holliday junction resolvase YEN1
VVIGIDARCANYCYTSIQLNMTHFSSTWFYECQVFSSRGRQHLQAGQNPELRVLFYRLAALSRLPISAVFVFDGDRRPKSKRGKAVRTFPHWLTTSFRKLAEAYGFYCHTVLLFLPYYFLF